MTDVTTALAAITDSSLSIERKADAYARLRQLRREIDRLLKSRPVRDLEHQLVVLMDDAGTREYGDVRMTLKSIEPKWTVNAEGNWVDYGVQDDLKALAEEEGFAPFIKHVVEHYEIVPKALADAMRAGDPAALRLWGICKDRKYRTVEGREPVLTVTEPPSTVEKAA
jgi:hypothetical protein